MGGPRARVVGRRSLAPRSLARLHRHAWRRNLFLLAERRRGEPQRHPTGTDPHGQTGEPDRRWTAVGVGDDGRGQPEAKRVELLVPEQFTDIRDFVCGDCGTGERYNPLLGGVFGEAEFEHLPERGPMGDPPRIVNETGVVQPLRATDGRSKAGKELVRACPDGKEGLVPAAEYAVGPNAGCSVPRRPGISPVKPYEATS